MKKITFSIILVFVLSLMLSACGSSNKATLNVTTTDFSFDSKTYTVPAGAEVTVNLTNNGATEHEFVVLKSGEHVTPPFGDKDKDKVFFQLNADSGKTVSETFTAPSTPGEYDIICGLPGHLEQGMIATLVVQ